jgi:tetratricopeptide (TPR) repeat protein
VHELVRDGGVHREAAELGEPVLVHGRIAARGEVSARGVFAAALRRANVWLMRAPPSRLRSCLGIVVVGVANLGLLGCGDTNPAAPSAAAQDSSSRRDGDEKSAQKSATTHTETPGADDAAKAGADTPAKQPGETTGATKPPRDVEAGKADRKRFLTALDAGRVASKQGAYTEAIVKFREALEANPSNAATLGELGWAAFKAGDLTLAETSTEQALRHADTDSQRGMLLYNLGRVAEARGSNGVAIEHYRRSLALRDNDTVRERLKSLGGETIETKTMGLTQVKGTFESLEAACRGLSGAACFNAEYGEGGAEACSCTPTLEATQFGGDVGLLIVQSTLGPSEKLWHPAFKTAKGWVVFEPAEWEYNPGAFGIFEEVERVSSEDIGSMGEGADARRFVRFRFVKSRHDSDMGICEIEFESHDLEVVCSMQGELVACTPPIVNTYSFTREVDRELCDEETLKTLPTDSTPVKITYTADVSWTMTPDAAVVVANVGTTGAPTLGLASRPLMLAAGTYGFAILSGSPAPLP